MSYSASDLVDDVGSLLGRLGYEVNDHNFAGSQADDLGGWSWTFADAYTSSERFGEGCQADFGALRDYCERAEEVKKAAARALSRWEQGDLAQAMRELQAALDASVSDDIMAFIEKHA